MTGGGGWEKSTTGPSEPVTPTIPKGDEMPKTFFCLECGLDRDIRDESDYEQDVCKECAGEEENHYG